MVGPIIVLPLPVLLRSTTTGIFSTTQGCNILLKMRNAPRPTYGEQWCITITLTLTQVNQQTVIPERYPATARPQEVSCAAILTGFIREHTEINKSEVNVFYPREGFLTTRTVHYWKQCIQKI